MVSPGVSGKILPSNPPKDPILMAVLSFFIPWLGQILIGQVTKGIVMLLVTPVLFALFVIATLGMGLVVLPFVGLIAVIDAYLLAKKLRDGQAIGDWEFFAIESAPTLAMPELLPKATDQEGRPLIPVKPRPPGLMGSAIGMLFVSGLAMVISILGVVGIAVNERMPVAMQIFLALSFVYNAWVIFAIFQTIWMQRYAFAITAPLLVMGSWMWLTFSGVPIGLSVIGILGGISVGVWSLGVLRQLEVRAAFEDQFDPLEVLLPMASASNEGHSPSVDAIKGLLKQLMGSKLALALGCVFVLLLLLVPLISLLRSTNNGTYTVVDGKKVQKVSGSFRSISGQTGKVSFGVSFSVSPKVTLSAQEGEITSAFRKTMVVETSTDSFTWRQQPSASGITITGTVLWEAVGE